MSQAVDGAILPTLAITSGEPAGVGPELCATLARMQAQARPVVLGDRDLLARRARLAGIEVSFAEYDSVQVAACGLPRRASRTAGRAQRARAESIRAMRRYVLALLDRAIDGCLTGEFAGHGDGAGAQGRHQRRRRVPSAAIRNTWRRRPAHHGW